MLRYGDFGRSKAESTTTEEQKHTELRTPHSSDEAELRSEGVPGEYHPPGAASVVQFKSLFRQKRRKRAQNCDTFTPVTADTPTKTIPRKRAPGCRGRREPPAKKKPNA